MNPLSSAAFRRFFAVLALIFGSSAGAVLVELSATERVKVRPILELVKAVDRLGKASESQFSCGAQQTSFKTVRRDPQNRVRFIAYRYTVPSAREERVRFFYYDARGKLKLMQYYSSGTYAWGQSRAEVWETYFVSAQPLVKTLRSGKLWNTLKPLEVLEQSGEQAARRSPQQDCARLFPG